MDTLSELDKLQIRTDFMEDPQVIQPVVDMVNNPNHYKSGNMEVIEVIDEFVPDPYSYYMGNVIKYVLRHMQKGKEKQDLEKARWYLNKMIEDWDD